MSFEKNCSVFQIFLNLCILDNARELHFIIIRMQEFNNFIRQGMGKILSKTRSNWLSCLAWNFVMSHEQLRLFLLLCKSYSVFCNYIRYPGMSHLYDSLFWFHLLHILRFYSHHRMATLWSLLSDFTSTSFIK